MNISHQCILATIILASLGCANTKPDLATQQRKLEDARKISTEYMQSLGAVLKQQLQTDGAEGAVAVCKEVAPAMSAQYSNEHTLVKRVSFKHRNPTLGMPDRWEKQQLIAFEASAVAGRPLQDLETYAITTETDGRWFRYMKAIPTQAMCLQCHGTTEHIKPSIQALLKQHYPQDLATGYKEGDIRGAMVVRQKLE